MLEVNQIYTGDCVEVMKSLDDDSVDLVVTSPPYDNLRMYHGFEFDFEAIARELHRVVKEGGVVVWVVGDATIKGNETGTSFKQALYFKEIGFNLHDTMIWYKPNAMPQVDKSRFTQSFEYMFVFSNGKPKTAKPIMVPTKTSGKTRKRTSFNVENINKAVSILTTKPERISFNVYTTRTMTGQPELGNGTKSKHPAIFPHQLAYDHIVSWSNENNAVQPAELPKNSTVTTSESKSAMNTRSKPEIY